MVSGKIEAKQETILRKLKKVLSSAKATRNYRIITSNMTSFQQNCIYECQGSMHFQKARETHTGTIIPCGFYSGASDESLTFDIDIDNMSFSKVVVVCSVKNLQFMKFVDQNSLKPNSLGDLLISTEINLPIRAYFLLLKIDDAKGVLYGAPLLITT